jgi:hypothetical protein
MKTVASLLVLLDLFFKLSMNTPIINVNTQAKREPNTKKFR